MIPYRDPCTRELFTEDELEGIYDEQILAVDKDSLPQENTFAAWLREMVSCCPLPGRRQQGRAMNHGSG